MATKPATNKTTPTEKKGVVTAARSAKPTAKSAAAQTAPRVRTAKHKATVLPVAEAPVPEPIVVAAPGKSAHEAISQIAYGYWAARDYRDGNPEEDWLRAEAEYRVNFAA